MADEPDDPKPKRKKLKKKAKPRYTPDATLDPRSGAAQILVGETPMPAVPDDVDTILGSLDAARRKEQEKQYKRYAAAAEIAKYRWMIANEAHLLEDGIRRLNFDTHRFQRQIYQDAALDLIIFGSAQWGKTEWILCDIAASAAFGLKVMVVCSKKEKREKFVSSRVNPCFQQVQFYKQMIELAAQRGASADSTTFKHFGYGWINLINGEVAKDFTSHPTDKVTTDEHQECNKNNLELIPDRLSGSPFALQVRVGHPTIEGTEENNNLDWLYKTSNQYQYRVPCGVCRLEQKLTWWDNVVAEKRNKGGAVEWCRPRDEEWKPGGRWDMRPVCTGCHRPMDRLHEGGFWKEMNPGVERHGYKLSNLYNPNTRLDAMFDRYMRSRFKPRQMGEFVNKQLGEAWSLDGSKVNDAILAACANGDGTGIAPFKFVPANTFDWRPTESFQNAA